jgi:hypothetical protein
VSGHALSVFLYLKKVARYGKIIQEKVARY